MDIATLKDLYLTELQELSSVEKQLTEALPRLADRANDADLSDALAAHGSDPGTQKGHVVRILERHDAAADEHHDEAMSALIDEAEKWIDMIEDPALRDAALIASVQRMKHYEVAVYGTLATWAAQLGFEEDGQDLRRILEEERDVDAKLTDLAKREINPTAA